FAAERIHRLHIYLSDPAIKLAVNTNTQILVAYQVMCKYYELHKQRNIDISPIFSFDQYQEYVRILEKNYSLDFVGVEDFDKEIFYRDSSLSFKDFAYSRRSIRNFTGESVPIQLIRNSVQLSLTAPSVCNRQASKVYLLTDKEK